MKAMVILPFREPYPFRMVQFILETDREIERFCNFYLKDNPSIVALVDVIMEKPQPSPEEPQPPPKIISLQIQEGATHAEKTDG